MQRLLIATHNQAKVHELKEFLSDLPIELVSLSDIGIDKDVVEDGKTYEENAKKKALFFAQLTGLPAIADDGGIEIAALNGEPGIKSKRWLGYGATDEELQAHMVKVARKLPDDNRHASFVLVLTLALPDGRVWSSDGRVEGIIAKKPFKKYFRGFPFRLYFYLPDIKKYYHEKDLSPAEMKKYNHRFKAVKKLKPIIRRELKS